jgi:hypothetical protein
VNHLRVDALGNRRCRKRHFARLFAVIREYLEAMKLGRFSYRPGFACSWCDYREKGCGEWDGA